MGRFALIGLLALPVATSGCSLANDFGRFTFSGDGDGGVTVDAGIVDAGAGQDGGPEVDGGTDAGVPLGPTVILQTAGGAVISTAEHRLRVSFGAPAPMSTVRSDDYVLRLGPVR
jgi:hypothetical protein